MEDKTTTLAEVLTQSLEKAGRERDHAVIDGIAGMSREEFTAMVESAKPQRRKRARVVEMFGHTWLRVAAACIAVALVIYGINDWRIAQPATSVEASMFAKYYKVDAKKMQQYKNEGARENAWGGMSTAAILEEASTGIVSNSRKRATEGVRQLERLRHNPKCRQDLRHEVHWYLALGYLKQNKRGKARKELNEVVGLGSYHSADAQEILRKL